MSGSGEFNFPSPLIKTLRYAQRVAVLTGAGISAESGLPTFRDAMTGLWAKFQPQQLATPQAFKRDPRLVWEWYDWRRQMAAQARPNPGHLALARLEELVPQMTIFTQNVDNLHQVAGSRQVVELHGNIARVKCFEDGQIVESWPPTQEVPPHCPRCGGLLRPDVVWFGENLPLEALTRAVQEARQCDLFFSIGTSGQVEPAASLPQLAKDKGRGATVVTINLDVAPRASHKVYDFQAKAGEILPALVRAAWPEKF